jgi:hypothetical protein
MGDDIVGRGQAGIPGSDGASPYLRRDPFEISRFESTTIFRRGWCAIQGSNL